MRTYTEEQMGAACRRIAQEITARAHARYSSQLVGAALGALFVGILIGMAVAEVFRG